MPFFVLSWAMAWTNYHGHTHFCDGKYDPEAYIKRAIENGMPALGISSHAPVNFPTKWAMLNSALPAYVAQIRKLQIGYQEEIQVYVGLEVDYIPHRISVKSEEILAAHLDYTIGSVHFVDEFEAGDPWEIDGTHEVFLRGLREIFHHDAEAAVRRYYALMREMVQHFPPDVIGHLDKIKMQSEEGSLFSEEEDWYQTEVLSLLEEIRGQGTIVEINTRGAYKNRSGGAYPSPWIIEQMKKMNIPICLNSDAHHPNELERYFEPTAHQLLSLGYQELFILLDDDWQSRPFNTNGLIL